MAVNALATAFAKIVPTLDSGALKAELGKATLGTEGIGKNIGTNMHKGIMGGLGGLTASIGGLLAAVGVGAFLKDTIQSASLLQDTVAAAGTVFGAEANTLTKWAEGASQAFGSSKQQALDAALTFGTFGKAAGLSGTDLTGFSSGLAQLAGDMASFRGTSTEQAIEAVGAALRGEMEPIRAYGVLLDDATLKAQAMEMGIYDGNGALTGQQKVLAAQAAILKQTSDAQGDYARTSDSAANTQKTFLTSIENLKAEVGTELLPVFTDLVKAFSDSIPALKEALIPAVKELAEGFKNALPQIIAVIGFVRDNIGWLSQMAGAITGIVLGFKLFTTVLNIWNGIVKLATGIQIAFNIAMSANVIALIIIAVVALIAGIVYLATQTTFFQDTWANMCAAVNIALEATGQFFNTVFTAIGQWWTDMVNGIVAGFQGAVTWIGDLLNTVGGFFAAVWNGIGEGFRGMVNWIISLYESMINFIIGGINNFLSLLNGGLGAIKDLTGLDLQIGTIPNVALPRLAKGGIVMPSPGGTIAQIAEAGQPEAVIPLSKLDTMLSGNKGNGTTFIYNAAENRSLSKEQELLDAMKRAKIQGAY